MNLIHCLSALLVLHSQLVGASIVGSDLLRRSTTTLSARAAKATKANGKKRGSIVLVVIIIIVVVAILIGLVAIIYLCRRRSKNRANKQALNLDYVRTSTGLPASETRREGDWWHPPSDTRNSTIASSHPNATYSQGGQGYTYGVTAEQHDRPLSRTLSPNTRTITSTRTSVHSGQQSQDEPFQIPVASFARPPGRPASITPSYHTEAAGGEISVEASTRPYVPPVVQPPTQFQPRQHPQPLQPQLTGASIYSSPYGGMTHSTSGHPGDRE